MQLDVPQPDPETRLVLNHETGRYVRIGLREYEWLGRLDGQLHAREIPALFEREPEFVSELLHRMAAAKLVCLSEEPVRLQSFEQQKAVPVAVRRFEWTQFGQMRIHISQAKSLLERIAGVKLLSSKPFIALSLWMSVLGLAAGIRIMQVADLPRLLQTYPWHIWQICAIASLVFLTTMIHEVGHGVVCTYFGVPVRSLGIMLYYLQPAAYADITDAWQLKNKWHRVAISFAGLYVQAIVTSLAVALWLVLHATHHHGELVVIFIALNVFMIAFNLLPFVRLDGYWILSTVIGVPNLRDRAMEWWRVSIASLVTRRPINAARLRYSAVLSMTPLGRTLLACFGWTSTVVGAAMWLGGLGFLFRLTRWMRMGSGTSYLAVGGMLLAVAGAFVLQVLLARRKAATAARARQTAPAVAPVAAPSAIVTHTIDREIPIRLNPNVSVMDNRNGTLTFAWSTVDSLTVTASDKLFDALPALRRGISLVELEKLDAYDTTFEQTIQRLWHLKHLRYDSHWDVSQDNLRYSRQLGWLSMNTVARGNETAALSRLRSKSVTILGVGGLGSHVAWNLAACGVGELHLVDGDTIELSNLNRQLFYTPADVGRAKVEVAAERLREFNPELRIRTSHSFISGVDDVLKAIQGADFVVRSLDTPLEVQSWVNEACVRRGVPCSGAGFLAQGAIVGPTVIPGETACLACNVTAPPRINRGVGGTLAPVVVISAGLLAGEVVTYLGKLGRLRTAGRMLMIDAPTFSFNFSDAVREENCLICGQGKEVAV